MLYRILAIGPRLSSFLMDLSSAGDIICDDTKRILPVPARCTVQLCAYMFHDATAALVHFPLNTVLAEYGFQVSVVIVYTKNPNSMYNISKLFIYATCVISIVTERMNVSD